MSLSTYQTRAAYRNVKLKNLSEIKIDRSFVRPLPGTPEDRMAVQTVIGLAHQLGLRAIAVVAVMLYHANHSWLRGGFLGVEVFFVISGYLITLLLVGEHENFNPTSCSGANGKQTPT